MEIKNRLGYPPMLTFSSDKSGHPSTRTFNLHEHKARGGVGMITYESTTLIPTGGVAGMSNIGRDEDIPFYREFTDKIHKYNTKIGMQIGEGGLNGPFIFSGYGVLLQPFGPSKTDILHAYPALEILSPSIVRKFKRKGIEVKEIKKEQISHIKNEYGKGAKRAIEAGFDYITIHSGHGLLFSNFLSPRLNKRTDEYGGSIENRCRFLVETIEIIRENIGEKPPIFVRFSADELTENGVRIEESKEIAKILEKGGADCLDITQGIYFQNPTGIEVPTYLNNGCFIHLAEAIKKVVNIPVIGIGRIVDPKMADEFIQQGKADIINMGRQLICDADTPNKYFNGQYDDIRYCIGCLQSCLGVCVQDAFSGQNYQELTLSTEPKKIVVLGAGISGMEAARVSKLRGFDVEIYEKSDKVGGVMNLVAAEYKKGEFLKISNFLETQLNKLNVPIHLNKELTKEEISSLNPDILVLATGSEAAIPVNLKGKSNVITQDESIIKSKPFGKNIVIWGLNVYWKGGVETAVSLIEEGYNVKALIGSNKYESNWGWTLSGRRFWLRRYLKDKNIPIFEKAKLLDVTENGVKFLNSKKEEQFVEAEALIYCGSRITNGKSLKTEFEGIAPEIVLIGDCNQPRDIGAAMKDAQSFARNLK